MNNNIRLDNTKQFEIAASVCKKFNNPYITPEHMLYGLLGTEFSDVTNKLGITENLKSDLEHYFKSTAEKKTVKKLRFSHCLRSIILPLLNSQDNSRISAAEFGKCLLFNSNTDILNNIKRSYNITEAKYVENLDEIRDESDKQAINEVNEFIQKNQNIDIKDVSVPSMRVISKMSKVMDIYYTYEDFMHKYGEYVNDTLALNNKVKQQVSREFHSKVRKGVILYGENGVGKRTIALQQLANLSCLNIIIELDFKDIIRNSVLIDKFDPFIESLIGLYCGYSAINIIMYVKNISILDRIPKNYSAAMEKFLFDDIEEAHNLKLLITTDCETANLLSTKKEFENYEYIKVDEPSKDDIKFALKCCDRRRYKKRFTFEAIESVVETVYKLYNNNRLLEATKLMDSIRYQRECESIELLKAILADASNVRDNTIKRYTGLTLDDTIEMSTIDIYRAFTSKRIDINYVREFYKNNIKFKCLEEKKHDLTIIRNKLSSEVYGQDEAIESILKDLKKAQRGFRDNNKPIGTYLFVGQTGTGKTQLATSLSKALDMELVKFNMNEFKEEFDTTRLVGAPPGYVGYDKGGELVEKVRLHPNSVVLFDEIEKAHPSIFDTVMQIFDDGKLTDGRGEEANFSKCIIIMTSNAGVKDFNKRSIGFGALSYNSGAIMKAVKETFKPEFIGRLSDIIEFNSINDVVMKKIIEKVLNERAKQYKKNSGANLDFDNSLVDYVFSKLRSEENSSARDVYRLVDREVIDKTIDKLDELNTDSISVRSVNNELDFG